MGFKGNCKNVFERRAAKYFKGWGGGEPMCLSGSDMIVCSN